MMKKIVAAILMALVIGGTTAPPAQAFNVYVPTVRWWPTDSSGNRDIPYCFRGNFPGGLSGLHVSTIRSAVQRWNGLSSNFRFYYNGRCPDGVAHPFGVKISWVTSNFGDMARGFVAVGNLDRIQYGEIWINAPRANQGWWSLANQNCVVYGGGPGSAPNACYLDAYTFVAHEAGHTLGLAHTGGGGGACGSGYSFQNDEAACDTTGEVVMYTNAADGYRREMHSDDVNGIRYLYGN